MRFGPLFKAIPLVLSVGVLAGCVSAPQFGGDPGLKVLRAQELPAPDRMDQVSDARAYFVGPFDKLIIDVFGVDELSKRTIQVDASGRISFPLAGIIEVAGMTPGEIETRLADRLRTAYVRDPQVTVNLSETVSQVVTVEGQVKQPGLYPVIGHMTLMRAIARAQGTDEFSQLNDVIVFRTVKNERLAALYDLRQIRHGAYPDPEIFANDVVMVGDSEARRRFKDILQIMPAVATPLVIAADRLTK
ncbi:MULTISPECIES: polysaccharide biosynthesis/export family protein [Novosphingobium]|uniref:polysaccharide biosynthesis/export family protein n=1 Tax=Novosphingobium TaxID=165696 RepID=UPI001CD214AE|nr:polysaccharide biosynthesis/export family protein [Novosphingobium percolationis]